MAGAVGPSLGHRAQRLASTAAGLFAVSHWRARQDGRIARFVGPEPGPGPAVSAAADDAASRYPRPLLDVPELRRHAPRARAIHRAAVCVPVPADDGPSPFCNSGPPILVGDFNGTLPMARDEAEAARLPVPAHRVGEAVAAHGGECAILGPGPGLGPWAPGPGPGPRASGPGAPVSAAANDAEYLCNKRPCVEGPDWLRVVDRGAPGGMTGAQVAPPVGVLGWPAGGAAGAESGGEGPAWTVPRPLVGGPVGARPRRDRGLPVGAAGRLPAGPFWRSHYLTKFRASLPADPADSAVADPLDVGFAGGPEHPLWRASPPSPFLWARGAVAFPRASRTLWGQVARVDRATAAHAAVWRPPKDPG